MVDIKFHKLLLFYFFYNTFIKMSFQWVRTPFLPNSIFPITFILGILLHNKSWYITEMCGYLKEAIYHTISFYPFLLLCYRLSPLKVLKLFVSQSKWFSRVCQYIMCSNQKRERISVVLDETFGFIPSRFIFTVGSFDIVLRMEKSEYFTVCFFVP